MSAVVVPRVERLRGSPRIPGDKSISHRGLILGALAEGRSEIVDILDGADVRSTARCLRDLGVTITTAGRSTFVDGAGRRGLAEPRGVLDCGNSGTTMRLLMGVVAGCPMNVTLDGDASLTRRPMRRVAEHLQRMGASIDLREGNFAPVTVRGAQLSAIDCTLEVASAQVKSAIILAALSARGVTRLGGAIHSRDHTERMLESFGVTLPCAATEIRVPGGQRLRSARVLVPGDPSSAAFWLAAATLVPGSELLLEGLALNPTRTGFVRVLQRMGAALRVEQTAGGSEPAGTLRVGAAPLHGVRVVAEEVPSLIDELPLLAVLASQAQGRTEVEGAAELRVKESDRLQAVADNLRAMGVALETRPDGFAIDGPQALHGARLPSFHDHRIAMAFGIAALVARGDTTIDDAECVEISYPGFFERLGEFGST